MSVTWLHMCLGAVALYLLNRLLIAKNHPGPFPAGPRPWPLIGNLLDMPTTKEWVQYAKIGREYGGSAWLTVFGQNIMLISDGDLAIEMLDKKSAKYSSRPVLQMGGELTGWREALILMQYGPKFKEHKRYFHQLIGSKQSMANFLPMEEYETARFLQKVAAKPEDLSDHVRRFLKISRHVSVLGGWLDIVPEWVPGAHLTMLGCKIATARSQRVDGESVQFQFHSAGELRALARPSFVSRSAGAGDSSSLLNFAVFDRFVAHSRCAMMLFLEVPNALAHAEIDTVVGRDRLPSFSGRSALPYFEALLPFCPPARYPNPEIFDPERYIPAPGKTVQTDPRTFAFGFGRRTCPGINLADASLFISIAMSLAVFDIKKLVENGVEITPEVDVVPGSICHPKPYKCDIKPRSAKAAAVIDHEPTL
ncbi:cytochrome P450 [Athelia psychrophila]|uniref:Cytochrome P450 n=1 Tax=Athelia psychrophila TaxID=1759441 RepID=A0A166P1L4_9AGAM|nr:cytochrome P450 [Fibularhizoctonia sp. CBS 109695]